MTATSTSTEETLSFFNTIPKCAEILSQPDLRVMHPRNPDTFFHSTLRSNNGILKSVFIHQPAHSHTRTSDVSSSETTTVQANTSPQERQQEKEQGYILLHLGAGVSGQPDIAHGGFLATVLDQVTGTLIRASGLDRGRGAVTVYLNVNYKKPVGRVAGRKIYVVGEIFVAEADGERDGEGVCVACEGMFLVKRDGTGRI
ncbi:PaaI family thioesterase [Aspergillus novofumigatus IBT 16806]|uniref:Thioesterase family protein n=1 Tax=Aspergillus novofumigatus (strain IBT 16806) TaxID=1392255 RepID=A0A2I1CJ22_ASPN1|nr:thioesterase family protein [Aspergillus novofumigatus IBT 16806]PKX97621.1 thioesterase family protein [Aspergillus novofumigatus IBT 16806]